MQLQHNAESLMFIFFVSLPQLSSSSLIDTKGVCYLLIGAYLEVVSLQGRANFSHHKPNLLWALFVPTFHHFHFISSPLYVWVACSRSMFSDVLIVIKPIADSLFTFLLLSY